MVVAATVADVRAEALPPNDRYEYDPLQETQVLEGEPVLVLEKKGAWARIECPEQLEFTHNERWEGYPGWVRWIALTGDVRRHHRLKKLDLPERELREKILSMAKKHLGSPYLWGGRSLHDPANKDVKTGVDCSGLINWSFRQGGWFVPRDAQEQYMRSRPVAPPELKPADLIFLADKDKPKKMVHVAFYAGGEELLEAPQSQEKVRIITFKDRFGRKLFELKDGQTLGDRVIYFGSLFPKAE